MSPDGPPSVSSESESTDTDKEEEVLVSVSAKCDGVTLIDFLRHARGGPRFYWATSRQPVAFAGAGIARDLSAWGADRFVRIEAMAARIFEGAIVKTSNRAAAPHLFGGFAFRDDFVSDYAWAEFAPAQFLLPHFQFAQVADECWLTINSHVVAGDDLSTVLPAMHSALLLKIAQLQQSVLSPRAATDTSLNGSLTTLTSHDDWVRSVVAATQHIRAGRLRKVVLSRAAEACFDKPVDVEDALIRLEASFPDAYRFLFEPRAGHAFLGATPELLCDVRGRQVETMALAGSIGRGRDVVEDRSFADALMQSQKDREEHQIVADEIVARLKLISRRVDVGETDVMTLSNIQHLHTPIHAKLRRPVSAIKLAQRLHPTPALGGEPRAAAMQLISELEPVIRGWYGAPIGWVDHELNGAFVVAIRSAVAQDSRAWLYAGAGIVAASEPQREWDETALKFRAMAGALGVRLT